MTQQQIKARDRRLRQRSNDFTWPLIMAMVGVVLGMSLFGFIDWTPADRATVPYPSEVLDLDRAIESGGLVIN